jgi:hypothetical protein
LSRLTINGCCVLEGIISMPKGIPIRGGSQGEAGQPGSNGMPDLRSKDPAAELRTCRGNGGF